MKNVPFRLGHFASGILRRLSAACIVLPILEWMWSFVAKDCRLRWVCFAIKGPNRLLGIAEFSRRQDGRRPSQAKVKCTG